MSTSPFAIRAAAPSEMPEVFSVDDDATQLYARAGIELGLTDEHPFALDERRRWRRSAELGRLFVAVEEGRLIGFASLDVLDGEPYLDQLSVRADSGRRGVGRALLRRAVAWAVEQRGEAIWLTTYAQVAFNLPFYESEGFVVVPESECGPGVLHHVEEQRRWLPFPEHRVAMQRPLG
ncbi:MAG: GNAT family N-acetyltransferase [Myxococcales bacterium]|nr:GNAT family N-acetyltransferase [Myxococcales bacterium]